MVVGTEYPRSSNAFNRGLLRLRSLKLIDIDFKYGPKVHLLFGYGKCKHLPLIGA
jgi:dUTPase